MQNEEPIGQIRFELMDEALYNTTIYLDKPFVGKGIGPLALETGCQLVSNEECHNCIFIAQIKKNNRPSKKAFEKAGFNLINAYLIDGHITMLRKY